MDNNAFFKLGYGLYVLTTNDGQKDNGCIINTAMQATVTPQQLVFTVSKANYTCETLLKADDFNLSVLTEKTPFAVFQHFGMQSGRTVDKFAGRTPPRTANGVAYLLENVNAVFSGKIINRIDLGTHILFTALVTMARMLDAAAPSATYDYYHRHIKPAPQAKSGNKTIWRCKICGYEYDGETLPPDFICPLCKHGAADFERV